jgi:hypothetical protein
MMRAFTMYRIRPQNSLADRKDPGANMNAAHFVCRLDDSSKQSHRRNGIVNLDPGSLALGT